MNILTTLNKHLLDNIDEEQETLFSYFSIHYSFDHRLEDNPEMIICLTNKSQRNNLIYYGVDHEGKEEIHCSICQNKNCSHVDILISKLLSDPSVVEQIKQVDEQADNYQSRLQQNYFDTELKEVFDDIFAEEHGRLNKLIHLEPHLSDVRNSYALDLKIGNTKFYKVTNISRMLTRFKNQEQYQYGKELTVIHKYHNFDHASENLLHYLDKFDKNYSSYFIFSNTSLDDLVDIYQNELIYVDEFAYQILKEPLKINIHIDKQFKMHFTILEDNYVPFGKYSYINKKDYSIKIIINNSHIRSLISLIDACPLANIKERFVDFKYSFFNKYPDIFTFDEEILQALDNNPIQIEAYFDFDKKEEYLTCLSKYKKDNQEINLEQINNFYERRTIEKYQDLLRQYGFIDGVNKKSADIYNFLNSSLEDLKHFCLIYISEALKNMYISKFTAPSLHLSRNGSLLEIFMDESEYSLEELKEIYNAIKNKKKYILIKDNYINLNDQQAESFASSIDDFDLLKNHHLIKQNELPIYYAFKGLNDDLIATDELIEQVFDEVKNFSLSEPQIRKINGRLRPYQKDGVKWLYTLYKNGLGGILADDMGLGKTIETIAFIKTINPAKPILIVCPKSLIFNWENEFKRFANDIPTYPIYGTSGEREKIIKQIQNDQFGVYFISYDSLRNEVENFKDILFDIIILDEAQFIKNAFAKKTNAVKSLSANHMFALTGTPIENNIYDLWSIFDFIMPGYLSNLKDFKNKYEGDSSYQEKVKIMTSPFILRRRKEDVLKDLPDKYEIIYTVEMLKEQRKIYEAYRTHYMESLSNSDNNAMEMLGAITRLRQICVDPAMFIENYRGGSGKIEGLKEILKDKLENHHRILIFSQFVKELENVASLLKDKNINYDMITGDTSAKERLRIADEFNNKEDIKILLISLKAGGTGLNLIGADTVIHLDPWWNLAAQNQASDRAHRIGQTRAVEVIKIIAENSIEQKVLSIQYEKRDLIELMISDNDESIKKLSVEDLKNILLSR